MRRAEQGTAGTAFWFRPAEQVIADEVRLAGAGLDGPVRGRPPVTEHRSALEPAMGGQGRGPAGPEAVAVAHASSPACETAGSELADTSTGSGRMVSATRLPADSAVASAVDN